MPLVRTLLPALLAFSTLTLAVPSDDKQFQDLLNDVPKEDLHSALHEFAQGKFQHGVFQQDRTAVEAVHKDEPDMATSIVHLAKRQAGSNSTAIVTSAVVTSSSLEPLTETSTRSVPPSTTSSDQSVSPSPSTSEVSSTETSTITSSETTSSESSSAAATSEESAAATTSEAAASTATILSTSTAPNGDRSTVTAVTVIGGETGGPSPPGGSSSGANPDDTEGDPQLQPGAAARVGSAVVAPLFVALLAAALAL
ncbi:MAG: hypothetical protein M1833_001345 [Piccolia ochrophora]|nr:MAG: hypothetical protein M1833_001345 [Piccolia ochrophora]